MKKFLVILFFFILFKGFSQNVKYYLTSVAGQPWGTNANINCMNQAFGVGIWIQGYFETVNVNALLQPSVCMIFMDGSSTNANSLNNFLASNLPAIQNWVYNGGQLFLNAAPNQGGNISFGFGGVLLNYNVGPYSPGINAVNGMTTYPLFLGPSNPVGTSFTGNYAAQGIVTGPVVPIMTGTPGVVLADGFYGYGHVYFGSESTTNWQSPAPNSTNFRANLLSSLGACCGAPQLSITAALSSTSVCSGQNVTITPSGGPGPYTLYPGGQSGTVFVVSPTVTTYYSAVSTNSFGCQQGTTFRIVVSNTVPAMSISGNTVICSGGTINLTASGANTYSWSTGALTNTMSDTPPVNTTYTVIGTSTAGCTGTLTQAVQVNPNPNLSVSGNTNMCSGNNTLLLTANGASNYTWSTGALTATMTDAPITNTVYTLVGTSSLGCTSTMTQAVSYAITPTVSIAGGTAAVCAGSSVSLTASGANSYSWSNGSTSVSTIVNPTASTVYSVTGTSNGCSGTASQSVTVIASPVLSVSGNTVICSGQNASLTANGANSYTWSQGAFTSTVVVSPTVNTSYTVVGTGTSACTGSMVQNIVVNPNPTLTVFGTTAVCSGNTALLNALGANSYSWSNGATGGQIVTTPTATTIYTVVGTNTAGCSTSATFMVTYNLTPTVSISGGTVPVCSGSSVSLIASGANSYSWSNGSTNSSVVINPTATAGYSVIGTSTAGCSNSAAQTVTVMTGPNIFIQGVNTICNGQSTTLLASGAGSFTWSGGPTTFSYAVTPTVTTVYTVTGTGGNGCTTTTMQTVNVNPNPTVGINGSTVVCSGSAVNLNASGANTYSWSNGATNSSIAPTPTANTTYSVIGNTAGCTGTASIFVTVINSPTITVSGNNTICAGQSTTLTASGGNSYLWNNASFSSSIVVSPTASIGYTATGTAPSGCTGAGTILVTVNALPTPTVSGGGTLCAGQSATLIASGANTYTWDGGSNSNSIVVTPTVNTSYSVTGTSLANCTGSASAVNISVVVCTGINEKGILSLVKIFPNPNNGLLIIESDSPLEFNITDLRGRLIRQGKTEGVAFSVDLSEFDNGMYILTARNPEGTFVFKIVKN